MTQARALTISLFLFVFCSYAQLNRGLIASYYFSGNANDSIHHLKGQVRGASLAKDRFGNSYAAYCFDGQNDYINLGTNRDLRQAVMSLSLWVKINGFHSNCKNYPGMPFVCTRAVHTVEYYEAFVVGMGRKNHKFSGGNTSLLQQQTSAISRQPAEIDHWYHIVYMFDHDTIYLYVDGKLNQKNFKGFPTHYLVTDSVVLGYTGNAMPDDFKYQDYSWFNGCLDDIRFYNRLLTEEEIQELYHEPNPKLAGSPDISARIDWQGLAREFWYVPVGLAVLILLVVLLVRWRLDYFRRREKERNDLQQRFAQMEMRALRSQMNPHFIFNAINSIQHYVLTNEKELANKYLVKFSQLMRNILDLSKQELISLKDELETVQIYLEIESLRFNKAFTFSLNVAEGISTGDIRLPPLLIQPFVENAIWHGLLLKEGNKNLTITVFKKENELIIEIDDNGIGREASQKFSNKELRRRSFGMDITQDRLTVLDKVFGISILFSVVDKKDASGAALGTTVFIKIKL